MVLETRHNSLIYIAWCSEDDTLKKKNLSVWKCTEIVIYAAWYLTKIIFLESFLFESRQFFPQCYTLARFFLFPIRVGKRCLLSGTGKNFLSAKAKGAELN